MSGLLPHKRFFATLVLLATLPWQAFAASLRSIDDVPTVTNRVSGTYQSEEETISTVSRPVQTDIKSIPGVNVTPDDVDPSGSVRPEQVTTKTFKVCNSGTVSDRFIITKVTASAPGTIESLRFADDVTEEPLNLDPIVVGTSTTPLLQRGQCVGVQVEIATHNLTTGNTIVLALTANSHSSPTTTHDDGTIILAPRQPRIAGPENTSLPPLKLVNGKTTDIAALGQQLNYTISFRNTGTSTANNVVVQDDLNPASTYESGSLQLRNESLTDAADNDAGSVVGQHVEFRFAQVQPGELVEVAFKARVRNDVAPGTQIDNVARITSDNSDPVSTTTAVIVIDPKGKVFAGHSAGSIPIPGARLIISRDQNGQNPVSLSATGYAPNATNDNPFTTLVDGTFSFHLPEQSSSETYYLVATAPSYKTRIIRVNTDDSGAIHLHSMDGQPLAVAGGFALTNEDVSITNAAALACNIPLFESANLEIQKSADRRNAEIGDVVTYRISVRNGFRDRLTDVVVTDVLPPSFHYVPDSARSDSSADGPIQTEVTEQGLLFHLPEIGPLSLFSFSYRVRIGANARTGEQMNTAVAGGVFVSGEPLKSQPASAGVIVGSGVFGMRQMIIGRVFIDANGNGRFDKGETPVEGVRVYIDNGHSATTDKAGMYNFPALEDGAVVISLDPITLPNGVQSFAERGQHPGWAKLLRTPLGGGGLLKQDFALTARPSVKSTQPNNNFVKTVSTPVAKPAPPVVEPLSIPIAAGEVRVLTPKSNEVVMASALEVEAQVAEHWKVQLELNGERVGEQNIGSHKVHLGNKSESFRFIGLNLKPGPNAIRITPVNENGDLGTPSELVVMGRGPVKRLEIISKTELPAGGRIPGLVKVRAYDAWNNLAADGQVLMETSSGVLMREGVGNAQQVLQLESGEASIQLVPDKPGSAKLTASQGTIKTDFEVRIVPEPRPAILVGLAEMSFGEAAPQIAARNDNSSARGHVEFFYKGKTFRNSLVTIAYDSQRPLNRDAGRDRFAQPDPLERVYPLFGDTSTRSEEALSNSKLYFRLDHKRSFLMFGDMDAEMSESQLIGYSRKLTGVKVHLENSSGAQIVVTGARPDTAFARDVFPADQFGLIRLSHVDILFGSETVTLEVHDRRNPDLLVSKETLVRSVDYNLDRDTGQIYFLRPISAFDPNFNLRSIVVTYEYRANNMSSAVYTAKVAKRFNSLGLTVGGSMIEQRQGELGSFRLGGISARKRLVGEGELAVEWGMSAGRLAGGINSYLNNRIDEPQNGNALRVEVQQPISVCEAVVRVNFARSSRHFNNPFGSTVTPGSQRITSAIDFKPLAKSTVRLGFTHESNKTENVDNRRLSFSALWNQQFNERLRAVVGFDLRKFTDSHNTNNIQSKLFTAGLDWDATDKLHFAVKREQNLGEADPSYPNQTTLTASYQVNTFAKIFVAQRLASAPIISIADTSTTGLSASSARRETQVGVETKLGRNTSLIGRYQLENGINGTDSFAVIGLQQRLPLTKTLAIDFGLERGMHLAGAGSAFTTGSAGFSWTPNANFRSSAKFDLRNQDGRLARIISLGAAGRVTEGITTLVRFQTSRAMFGKSENSSTDITGAAAFRPLHTDRYALLFSYNRRSFEQRGETLATPTRDRQDTLSTDGLIEVKPGLEVYAKLALRFSDNGGPELLRASTTTFLVQGRVQKKVTEQIDVAIETRWLSQPVTGTSKQTVAAEVGYWVMRDLRVAAGYNFTKAHEPNSDAVWGNKRGAYVTISSKLSRLFNLIGTSEKEEPVLDDTARRNDQ